MAVFSLRQYYHEQQRPLPALDTTTTDVHSQTIMVIGSNVGLGFEASVQLAGMRPKLLIATSRDTTKCESTQQAIRKRTDTDGVPSPHMAAWPLDLGTFDNVRSFVDRFAAGGKNEAAFNALIANAGLYSPNYTQTRDDWEIMLQVNYLSTALLSILLLPHLVNASTSKSPSRLVLVTSFGHYLAPSSLKHAETWTNILETVNGRKFTNSITRYNLTKQNNVNIHWVMGRWLVASSSGLAVFQVMFIRELASRLPEPTPVVTCSVNPGYCRSNLFRAMERRWYLRWIYPAIRWMLAIRSTEEGSKTLVHPVVASDADARTMHARYLSSCKVVEESDYLFTPQGKIVSEKLWNETMAVLSRIDERVSEIVAKYLRAQT